MGKQLSIILQWRGPFENLNKIFTCPCVYLVLTAKKSKRGKWNPLSYEIIDLGQTGGNPKEKESYDFSERKKIWIKTKQKNGYVVFKFANMPENQYKEDDRKIIECFLREKHGPLKCGPNYAADFNKGNVIKILNSRKYKPLYDKYLK